jgi:hypothetical protein
MGYLAEIVLLILSDTEKQATAPTMSRIAADGMGAWRRVIARARR